LRFIQIPLTPDLPVSWYKIHERRLARVNGLETHKLRSVYIKKNASWCELKEWLENASGHKCWYCEAKSPRSPFDVDHFRPKLGITVDGMELAGHNGYYWLAYEWKNFRLSCQRCNRTEKDDADIPHGKANEFPIRDETQRCALPEGSVDTESPRFLDPCVQADCDLLAHSIDGEVKPVAPDGTWEFQRARYTIDRLGFNEWKTPEEKRRRWQALAILISVAGTPCNPSVINEIAKHLSHDQEYSSFFRSAIGTHREKSWVEELL
jgi:uncharacterized protein (TIGR02646 family)